MICVNMQAGYPLDKCNPDPDFYGECELSGEGVGLGGGVNSAAASGGREGRFFLSSFISCFLAAWAA